MFAWILANCFLHFLEWKMRIYLKKMHYKKTLMKQFFEPMYLKNEKNRVCAVLLLHSCMQFSSQGAYLLHAYVSQYFTLLWDGTHLAQKPVFISPISFFVKILLLLLFSLNYNTIIWICIIQKNSLTCSSLKGPACILNTS